MKAIVIKAINGVEILASPVKDGLVAIKPICEILGIAFERQFTKVKEDPRFRSTVTLRVMVGADGKRREMVCLPTKKFFGWLYTINPANVKESAKENLIKYQEDCEDAIYEYFFGDSYKRDKSYEKTARLLREKDEILLKEDKTGTDFMRYLEIEKELKEEQYTRGKINKRTIVGMRDLFENET